MASAHPKGPGPETRARSVNLPSVSRLAILAGAYLILSFASLDRFPPVHDDEPWIAASGAQLAATGSYGNPMFSGFRGADRHIFLYPPLLPILQAGVFAIIEATVVSMRIPSVLAGLAVLILTFAAAKRVGGPNCGLLAGLALLALAPAAGWNGTSGIPLLDSVRVARYDILVPAFGLAALLVFESRMDRPRTSASGFASGVFAGLATLSHLYGIFWLITLLALLALRKKPLGGRGRAVLPVIAGFALAILPLLAWILANRSDFLGQQQLLAERYGVLDPRFFLDNIVREPQRYRRLFTIEDPLTSMLARPGLWIFLIGLPLALVRALRVPASERERTGFAIAVAIVVHGLLFALLIQVKTYNYLISIWPLAVILLAGAGLEAWSRTRPVSGTPTTRTLRIILAGILVLAAAEGAFRIARWQSNARATAPYAPFVQRVAAHVPASAHVLGLQRYWLGFSHHRYTSWLVPVWWNDPPITDPPIPFDRAIERVAPDVILIDEAMHEYFDELANPAHPRHDRFLGWQRYTARHLVAIDSVADPVYGVMRILHVKR